MQNSDVNFNISNVQLFIWFLTLIFKRKSWILLVLFPSFSKSLRIIWLRRCIYKSLLLGYIASTAASSDRSITFCHSPLTISLVLFTFTLMPLFSTLFFHSLSLLIRSSSVSAITTKSSAYNSHGKVTLNSLDKVKEHDNISGSVKVCRHFWCVHLN